MSKDRGHCSWDLRMWPIVEAKAEEAEKRNQLSGRGGQEQGGREQVVRESHLEAEDRIF